MDSYYLPRPTDSVTTVSFHVGSSLGILHRPMKMRAHTCPFEFRERSTCGRIQMEVQDQHAQGLVMTRFPTPLIAIATKVPAPYVTLTQLLPAALARMVQVMPSGLVMTRFPAPVVATATKLGVGRQERRRCEERGRGRGERRRVHLCYWPREAATGQQGGRGGLIRPSHGRVTAESRPSQIGSNSGSGPFELDGTSTQTKSNHYRPPPRAPPPG